MRLWRPRSAPFPATNGYFKMNDAVIYGMTHDVMEHLDNLYTELMYMMNKQEENTEIWLYYLTKISYVTSAINRINEMKKVEKPA